MKLQRCGNADGTYEGFMFWCPGCERPHVITTKSADRPTWSFDGNTESPTFGPSYLAWWTEGEENTPHRCHLFIRSGKIEYCGDSLHSLAGKIIDLPEIPEDKVW